MALYFKHMLTRYTTIYTFFINFTSLLTNIILLSQYNWKKGLQVVEDAIRVMPKTISRHLFMHKLVFKSRMNKNIEGDMLKFQVNIAMSVVMF